MLESKVHSCRIKTGSVVFNLKRNSANHPHIHTCQTLPSPGSLVPRDGLTDGNRHFVTVDTASFHLAWLGLVQHCTTLVYPVVP